MCAYNIISTLMFNIMVILILFAEDPNYQFLTAKLLRQGFRYHTIRKAISKFYRRHFDIVSKYMYNVGFKTLLLQGLSEPEFYGDFVNKFRKIIGKNDFPYKLKR